MYRSDYKPTISAPDQPLFFTPSYRNDLDRLVLMRKSIRAFYRGTAKHVIAVPREDVRLFKAALQKDDCQIISQQSLVRPEYFPRLGFRAFSKLFPGQTWRLRQFAGKGGWIIQQVAKFMAAELVEKGPIVILDSDLFFVHEFDDRDLFPLDGHLLVRINPDTESGKHRKHIVNSRKLLGLAEGSTEHHYMSCPAILYAEWIKKLMIHIEALWGKPWQLVLHEQETLSEYSIYGVFVEEVLKPHDLVIREQSYNHMLWDINSYNNFFCDVPGNISRKPEKVCVVAQSALNIPVNEYASRLESLLR
jgi:hypothetical protein